MSGVIDKEEKNRRWKPANRQRPFRKMDWQKRTALCLELKTQCVHAGRSTASGMREVRGEKQPDAPSNSRAPQQPGARPPLIVESVEPGRVVYQDLAQQCRIAVDIAVKQLDFFSVVHHPFGPLGM